jgi:hypothetical protein
MGFAHQPEAPERVLPSVLITLRVMLFVLLYGGMVSLW